MMIFIICIVFIALEQKTDLDCIKVCENKNFCNVILPSKNTKILEFHQYQKFEKAAFVIYADLKCII